MVFLGLPFHFVSDGFRKGVLLLFFLLGLSSFAHAHPLGALSLNRYGIIDLYPQKIGIQLILDFAEVPSYRELEWLDANNDRLVSPKEMADYKRTVTRRYLASFTLFDGEGNPLDVEIQETQLTLLQGEAGLACIRILWKGSVFWEPNAFSSISLQFTDRGIPDIKGERKQFICLHPGMAIRESQNANFEQWKLMDAPMDAYQAEGAAASFSFKPAERAGEEELFGFT
ncbi:hypothetical protein GF373_00445, partial [bacterium]|nr:hypothetical protein [bacterium]